MLFTPVVLDGLVEHVPVSGPVDDPPAVHPLFLRSQRDTGFSCPGCRGDIPYAEVLYSDHPAQVRADVFGLLTGDCLYLACPSCGRTVHYMFQQPPSVLAMCADAGVTFRPRVRSFIRRFRGVLYRFFIRALLPGAYARF